jgi:CRP-like cAMP-binding protein
VRKRDEQLDYLARVSLFRACGRDELKAIAAQSSVSRVDAGRILVREGQVGAAEFFVIVEGEAEVTRAGAVIARMGPGEYFGELSLLDPAPRDATITCSTAMELLVLTWRELETLLVDAPGMTRRLLQGMAARLRELDRRNVA